MKTSWTDNYKMTMYERLNTLLVSGAKRKWIRLHTSAFTDLDAVLNVLSCLCCLVSIVLYVLPCMCCLVCTIAYELWCMCYIICIVLFVLSCMYCIVCVVLFVLSYVYYPICIILYVIINYMLLYLTFPSFQETQT